MNFRFNACKYAQMKAKKVDRNALAIESGSFSLVIFGKAHLRLIKSKNSSDHKSVLILVIVWYYSS